MSRLISKMSNTTVSTSSQHYDTIVLGAGMAGLSCAARLLQHPSHQKQNSLLVLEARDRIGGRIGNVTVNGNRLDTGANWIHGTGTEKEPNPLVEVLPHKKYKALSGMVAFRPPMASESATESGDQSGKGDEDWVEIDGTPSSRSAPAATQPGASDLVIPSDSAAPLMGTLWGMIGSLHESAASVPAAEAKKTTTLQAIIRSENFQSAFQAVPKDLHQTLRGMPQFIENMEAAPLAAQSAEHDRDHPGFSLLEFGIDDFDGEQVFLRDGYVAVIDEVAKDLVKEGLVELGTEVQQICWNANATEVKTSKGSFTAKRVVCALPLGMLQHRMMDSKSSSSLPLFEPALPREKMEAIASQGFGTLDKIFLVYSHPWWIEEPWLSLYRKGIVNRPMGSTDTDSSSLEMQEPDSFMGFTSELPGISIHPDGHTEAGLRILSVINLHSLTGFPVLSTFVSCSNATYIESLSNKDAGAIVHRSLTSWLGREPPKPDAVHVTRWAQDEYSRGSYSHMITGVTETKHREEFQKPVLGGKGAQLRFAGEHTSLNHFATVHGALLSGWREADGIIAEVECKGS